MDTVAAGEGEVPPTTKGRHSERPSESSNWSADYEMPELEFDEFGIELEAQHELDKENYTAYHKSAISSGGILDEDFEGELGSPSYEPARDPEMDFRDVEKYGIVQVAGDDTFGRKVIVFSACKLPDKTQLDHDRLLLYLKYTLDQYVENDYTLVYFHYGLCRGNKPTFGWLRQAYREFDRKYKKNLKALYVVHPTNFIKIIWKIFKKFISGKFHEKVFHIDYLHDLAQHLQLDQIQIPQAVINFDAEQLARNKPTPVPTSFIHAPLITQQFGVSLQFIKDNNNGDIIPPVLRQCVDYIRQYGMETDGIFRRSANARVLRKVQQQFNKGEIVDFAILQDPHIPEAMVKSFLRQLPEPLMTFDLYDHIVHVQTLGEQEKLQEMRRILHDELPEDNFVLLKYLLHFLTEVSSYSTTNRMTAQNLAVVFGPNLMWSKTQASLTTIGSVNTCALLLITHYHRLFE